MKAALFFFPELFNCRKQVESTISYTLCRQLFNSESSALFTCNSLTELFRLPFFISCQAKNKTLSLKCYLSSLEESKFRNQEKILERLQDSRYFFLHLFPCQDCGSFGNGAADRQARQTDIPTVRRTYVQTRQTGLVVCPQEEAKFRKKISST